MSHAIYPINPPNCRLPIVVFGIGYEDNQPHVLRKEGFPVPQLFICKSGEGTLKVNDNNYIIRSGSYFFIKENTPHEYYGNTEQWEVEWIAFSGNHTEDILYELNYDNIPVGTLNNFDKISSLFNKIFITLKIDDPTSRIIASGVLYEILIQFHKISHNHDKNSDSKGNSIINRVMLYIDENFSKEITIEELAELVNVTPQYLCRLFKKYVNLRPFQYIAMKKIQYAKELLSDNSLSVNEIAHMVGYNDSSYFCAIFKKYERISPSEFKGLKYK